MLALPLLFFIPFAAALLVFSLSKVTDRNCRNCAFILSLIPLVFLLLGGSKWQGALYDHEWFPSLGIRFHLAIDNLSLIFLYLTNIIVPIAIMANTCGRAHFFYGLILALQGLLIGFFTSCDLVFFTFFFEAILLPLYFLISNKKTAMTFIIYMITGSCLMVVGVLSLYVSAGTFDIAQLSQIARS
ncbi:MAG: hypothetical protein LLF94_11645, partial [Chlamydiales bacterium]|nr:hypothetical protein [Chlamydiales bacterium]